jgi:hypothetical protein
MHAVALRDALARRVEHAVVLDEHDRERGLQPAGLPGRDGA